MTEKEMRYHHYRMGDRIVFRILETEKVVDIAEMKKEYTKALHSDLITHNNCFMCEYAMTNTSINDITNCDNCPSRLQFMPFGGCLSGLYYICVSTKEWKTQSVISSLIRDSWR